MPFNSVFSVARSSISFSCSGRLSLYIEEKAQSPHECIENHLTQTVPDFVSRCPLMHKTSVIRSLFNRAKGHSSCVLRLHKTQEVCFTC